MSSFLNRLQLRETIFQTGFLNKVVSLRSIYSSSRYQYNEEAIQKSKDEHSTEQVQDSVKEYNPKDRSTVIPVEQSIEYLISDAYKETYGNDPVWKTYVRNYKGQFPPRKTRKTCIRNSLISTASPCPICRDEYLVLDYTNVKLLKQFINEHNGEVLSYTQTGLCQKKHKALLISIIKAKDYGILTFDVPFRKYNYKDWSPYPMEDTNDTKN